MTYKKKFISLVVFLSVLLLIGCGKSGYSGPKYIGTEGGKTVYQDVKTDVVELTIYYYSDMPPVSDVFIKNDEGTYFKEEAYREYKELIPVNEDIFNKLNTWVDEYNIKSWDGYNMTQKDVMDGGGFGLNITLATGETITANGSNAYPQGYSDANKSLKDIIAQALEEINKSSKVFINDRWSFYNDFVDSPIEGDIVLDKDESILLKYHYPNKGEHYINSTEKCISVSPMGIDGIHSDAYVILGVRGVYKGESFIQIVNDKGDVIDEILITVTNETYREVVNPASEPEEVSMKLYINDKEIPVKWEENDSVNELTEEVSKNDITVEMSMYSDNEQVGSLGKKYSSSDKQTTTHNGDIVLYNSSNMVVFYGSNSWAYTRLGKMELSEQEVVEMLSNGNVTIRITD